jgi:hypothetical protein
MIGKGLAALGFAGAILGTALVASAQITLYNGAVINARMNQTLSTASAHAGDTFSMMVVPPYPAGDPRFQGATITGVVTSVQKAGQGRPAQIQMRPQYLRLADGSVANVSGDFTSVQRSNTTANDVGRTAAGAIAGMLIGNAIGKMVFHASGGGPAGFIAGGLLGANSKSDFSIAQGTPVTLQLNKTVVIRRQAAPPK